MTKIEIVDEPAVATAVIRRVVAMAELRDFYDSALPAVIAAIAAQGGKPAGPPFARYFGEPGDTADLELGFPVARAIEASGDVRPGALPAGRIYQAVHTGPYDTLAQTYRAIAERMASDGAQPAGQLWEYYTTDPREVADPRQWQTRLCRPFR